MKVSEQIIVVQKEACETTSMDGASFISTIDQKMAEMRIKNLELLKRHQEIEEDRQLAKQSGAITTLTKVESTEEATITMRGTTKNRGRSTIAQQNFQKNPYEQSHRPPVRRKFENDRTDVQPQRVQRVDYNRLKRERAQEVVNQQSSDTSINPELLEYTYPFCQRSENNYDADEPAHANKIVIINTQGRINSKRPITTRAGSGRFNQQQQRIQEPGQRRREERMRRSAIHNNGYSGENSEFHLDMPQIPMWQNSSLPPPIHVQLLPTNLNGQHSSMDHFFNNGGDQLDQSMYPHNFMYPSPAQSSSFNGNGPIYFAHPPSPMSSGPPSSQTSQSHFHQYFPTRTFENSNRHQFHHSSQFQPLSMCQPPVLPPTQLSTPSSSTSHAHQEQEDSSVDLPPRFHRLQQTDQENQYSKQRPMSGDFEHLHKSSSQLSNDNRFQSRPRSFYDFSSQQQVNNNFFRSPNNNNHYQRNNNNNHNNNTNTNTNNNNSNILPLAAYLNTNDRSYQNENINNHNYWGTSYQRRRTTKPRTYHQDKHQFPLSLYDPRQYGFDNNYQRKNDSNNRPKSNRRNINNSAVNDSNDIDLIEEWWEDDNTELIGIDQSTANIDSQIATAATKLITTTVDDSGNSSLSTSIHLKESVLDDDDENNTSTNDFISPPSDVSTTDSNIIESLDQLQQQLKLEEDVEKQLALENDLVDLAFISSNKEEIEQHDAVTTDDDDDDDDNIVVTRNAISEKFHIDQTTDEDHDNYFDNSTELEDDLHAKLTIEEDTTKSVVVE
ncbi:unnamed protein product [Rotaria magnacalcarata]